MHSRQLALTELFSLEVPEDKEFSWNDDIDVYGDNVFVVKWIKDLFWTIDVYSISESKFIDQFSFEGADAVVVLSDTVAATVTTQDNVHDIGFFRYSSSGYELLSRFAVTIDTPAQKHQSLIRSTWTSLEQQLTMVTKVFGEKVILSSVDMNGLVTIRDIVYKNRKFSDVRLSYLALDDQLILYTYDTMCSYVKEDGVDHPIRVVPKVTLSDTVFHVSPRTIMVRRLSSLDAYMVSEGQYHYLEFDAPQGYLVPTNSMGIVANMYKGVLRILKVE